MSVLYIEHPEGPYLKFVVDGPISKADIDRVMPLVRAFLDAHDRVAVLQVVRRLGLVNLPAALPHAAFGLGSVPKIRRAALVTGVSWLSAMTRATAVLSPVQTRVFGPSEEAEARAWVSEAG